MGYSEAQAKAFIQKIAPLIRNESIKRGYAICSTVIAQAIIEGACGTSGLAKPPYNNHFGLKCGSSWHGRSVNMKTKEEYKVGSLVTIKDNFRCYDSMQDCVVGYYDFISTKRYANLKTAQNYIQYAQFLKADGYATSSTYVNTLVKTVEKYALYHYDNIPLQTLTHGYQIGKVYEIDVNLYVRKSPEGEKMKFDELTPDGKKKAYFDDYGYAILRAGSRVTCQDVKVVNVNIWMKIPSGYICAKQGDKTYVVGT